MNYFLLGVCFIVVLVGCKQDDVIPATSSPASSTSGSKSAITFAASDWTFQLGNTGGPGNPNQYQSSIISEGSTPISSSMIIASKAESYSLGIETLTMKDTASFCYWATAFAPPKTLQPGKSLMLKAKVQLQNVQGKGVSLVLRGDRNAQPSVLFATTQGKISLTGTNEFVEYSITLPYSTSVDSIVVYLVMLNQTTGKVLLKDVSLQVN